MAGRVPFVLGFALLAVFLQHAASQGVVHTVGDATGWTNVAGSAFYANWAASKSFVVGDSLVFNFAQNHDVVRVPKRSYDMCDDENEIGDSIEVSPARFTLNTSGEYFFICTITNHCSVGGQKLAINVTTTRGPMTPPNGSPMPSPGPGGPMTPGGGPTTPGGGPQATSPPSSSANAIVGAFSVTLLGIIMSLY